VTGLVLASLVASLVSGNAARAGLPVPLDRVFLLAALGLMVLDRSHPERTRLRWRTVHAAMLSMLLWTAWSALSHGTLQSSYGFFALVDRLAVPFLLFALAPVVFATETDRRRLRQTLVVLGLYLGLTAVFELSGMTALVFPRYIMDPHAGILFGRARGPLVEAEADGMLLAACFFAAALSTVRTRGVWRVLSAASAALSALGVLLTLTRSVWIGTSLGVLVLVLVVPALRRRVHLFAAAAVAGFGALLMLVPSLAPTLIQRLTTERSVYDRQNTNAAALRVIAAHPLDGIGWMRFLGQSIDWVRQADGYPVTNVDIEVHNVVLSRAAELGLVGAALWVWCVLAGPGLALLRRPPGADLQDWRLVGVGYACVWAVCIMVSPVPYVLPNNLLWLFAGMLMPDYLTRRTASPLSDLSSPDPGWAAPVDRGADDAAASLSGPRADSAPPGGH
jgi:O-antigen ligase